MKNKLLLLGLMLCLSQFFYQTVFSQKPISPIPSPKDDTVNIKSSELNTFLQTISSDKFPLETSLEPEATLINFDDVIINGTNSNEIAPNRYNGVSFYSPYDTPTWATFSNSYSYPAILS